MGLNIEKQVRGDRVFKVGWPRQKQPQCVQSMHVTLKFSIACNVFECFIKIEKLIDIEELFLVSLNFPYQNHMIDLVPTLKARSSEQCSDREDREISCR